MKRHSSIYDYPYFIVDDVYKRLSSPRTDLDGALSALCNSFEVKYRNGDALQITDHELQIISPLVPRNLEAEVLIDITAYFAHGRSKGRSFEESLQHAKHANRFTRHTVDLNQSGPNIISNSELSEKSISINSSSVESGTSSSQSLNPNPLNKPKVQASTGFLLTFGSVPILWVLGLFLGVLIRGGQFTIGMIEIIVLTVLSVLISMQALILYLVIGRFIASKPLARFAVCLAISTMSCLWLTLGTSMYR